MAGFLDNAFAAADKIQQLAKKVRDSELHLAIADMKCALADARTGLAEYKEEVIRLRNEIAAMNNKSEIVKRVIPSVDGYVLKDPDKGEFEGPYCVSCVHCRGELVPLIERLGVSGRTCRVCGG